MLTRLGRFAVRRRRIVLVLTAVFMVVGGVVGTGAFGVLQDEGFNDPSSESQQAIDVRDALGAADPGIVVVADAVSGDVDDAASVDAGLALSAELETVTGVAAVTSYWTAGTPPSLRSTAGEAALALVEMDGAADSDDVVADVEAVAAAAGSALRVGVGGGDAVGAAFGATIEGDLGRAEMIAVPITLALLVIVFGGLVAASLPLFVGIIAVLGTFLSLLVIGSLTDVSLYAINLTTALGLGLAIDYSLFIVSRYREELRAGRDVEGAIVRTLETAGRTIALSGLTVAVSLSALLVFPQYFLRSFAYAGIAVVVLALVGSLVSLPALLAVVGTRIDAVRVLPRRAPRREEDGFWYRTATRVMRRPLPVALAVVAVLLVLGSPFLGVRFGNPDARMLPESAPARLASEQLQAGFSGDASEAFPVVVRQTGGGADEVGALADDLAARVSNLAGVDRVEAASGTYGGGALIAPPGPQSAGYAGDGGAWLSVVPSIEMMSDEGEALVATIRNLDETATASAGEVADVLVGGQTAQLIDSRGAIGDRLPLALSIIVLTTIVLLFMMSGSLLVPLKALVLNLLSLTATFGAMVWVFQDGNLSGLLGFTATGAIDTSMPILMFCIAFGLSMDYEVFLLSRIKEEHDRTGDNDHAVALGLERTGRIVTAAALLLSVTFFAFGTSGVSFIKMFGIGLGLAILMDAFVIRGLLVPAFMKLAGEANWWAPGPLRRLHDRFGIGEGEPVHTSSAASTEGPVAPAEPVARFLVSSGARSGPETS
ncbi:MAG: MMPL family transporter [Acidimicrobiia bacterium]|nr:MMPL family transporter [Acidimicrobiia bacterium]